MIDKRKLKIGFIQVTNLSGLIIDPGNGISYLHSCSTKLST